MIDKIEKELCTGCNACFNICPVNCIDMKVDSQGFRYPSVDYDKCIKCKKCINACPSYNKINTSNQYQEPKIYAAWSLDEKTRFTSTSGGLFTEFAKDVVADGGLVVGAIYNDKHQVNHYMTDNVNGIRKLKQSKYVQSDIVDIFKTIKKELDSGKELVFCGSPCQVAGLINFLKKHYINLITLDFVCRGTNSPKAYGKYIEMLEKNYGSKVKRVWFKNKKHGWNRFSTKIEFSSGKTYIKDRHNDIYMRGYIEENLYIRPCCEKCQYKTFPRVSDITMGDFWGIGVSDPSLDPDKGTSLIMINSEKGVKLFNNIKKRIYYKESDIVTAIKGNGAIIKSVVRNPNTEKFLEMLNRYDFDVCFGKCVETDKVNRFKINVRARVARAKRLIKRLLKV